jgi:plasmid stabilization system protein ParE
MRTKADVPVRSKFTSSRRRFTWRAASDLNCEVIFYRALPDGVEVVRVMSGRQDIDADDMA